MKDGEVRRSGRASITAHATPGHTMGSMTWSWNACEGKRCKAIVFASSLNPVSADRYRFTAPSSAPIVKGFEASYRRMGALKCDILISAHPDNAGAGRRSEEQTSELQSLMRISYAVFCLKKTTV